jgi:serine/threonine protein kinase
VIHRDLKPGNLFLTNSADVKLGDFGIARDLKNADITAAGMTVGTHAYMAPEQITGDDSVSGKADLYSLGCCLFEMLVGRTPFVGGNSVQLLEQHLRTEPPHVRNFVSNCPAELDEVVYKLLAKNPDDRPFNARSVQAVMLQLGESPWADVERSQAVAHSDATHSDATADDVATRGREILRKRIQDRICGAAAAEVSWGKLAFMLAAIVGVIAVAAMLRG